MFDMVPAVFLNHVDCTAQTESNMRNRLVRVIFACLFLAISSLALGQSVTGKVVRIIDGDTYDLLTPEQTVMRIRMYGIDAPERSMPFYSKSKEYLASICFSKEVRMEMMTTDRNGRVVGKTFLPDGKEAGEQMVLAGMAWHFTRYSSDQNLHEAEQIARKEKRGLWFDPDPVAPWDWRWQKRAN